MLKSVKWSKKMQIKYFFFTVQVRKYKMQICLLSNLTRFSQESLCCSYQCDVACKAFKIASTTVYLFLTHNFQFQTKGALACFVACNAGVSSTILLHQRVNNQRMNTILPHQHLVGEVWIDWSTVDEPHQFWVGQSTYLVNRNDWR